MKGDSSNKDTDSAFQKLTVCSETQYLSGEWMSDKEIKNTYKGFWLRASWHPEVEKLRKMKRQYFRNEDRAAGKLGGKPGSVLKSSERGFQESQATVACC